MMWTYLIVFSSSNKSSSKYEVTVAVHIKMPSALHIKMPVPCSPTRVLPASSPWGMTARCGVSSCRHLPRHPCFHSARYFMGIRVTVAQLCSASFSRVFPDVILIILSQSLVKVLNTFLHWLLNLGRPQKLGCGGCVLAGLKSIHSFPNLEQVIHLRIPHGSNFVVVSEPCTLCVL